MFSKITSSDEIFVGVSSHAGLMLVRVDDQERQLKHFQHQFDYSRQSFIV